MKFCVTDAIQLASNLACRLIPERENITPSPMQCFTLLPVLLALNVDFALQVGAFLNRNPLGGNVAGHHRRLAQFHAVAGLHVSLEFALHHNALGLNRSFHRAIGADGQAVVLQGDAALDLSIDIKVFAARQFAFDDNRLANLRQIADNGALMDVLLKEAGYCTTKILERQVPDGRVASLDYTQLQETAASDVPLWVGMDFESFR